MPDLMSAFRAQPEVILQFNRDAPKWLKEGKSPSMWARYQAYVAMWVPANTYAYVVKAVPDYSWAYYGSIFILAITVTAIMDAVRREGRWGIR